MLGSALRYKDYYAEVSYDSSADAFHGRVLGMRDVIDFYGRTPEELREEFKNSIEDYLSWCSEEGEKPEKSWQGRLTLRPDEELRRRLVIAAAASGKSVNKWVTEVLEREAQKVIDAIG